MEAKEYTWIEFYTKFANTLLQYKNNRQEIVRKLTLIFINDIGKEAPKLSDGEWKDIDPFTVYALFNRGMTEQNRINFIKGLMREFNIDAECPRDFNSIPVVQNLNCAFYRYEGDPKSEINDLWEMFEKAVQYADNETDEAKLSFLSCYNKIKDNKGLKFKLSIGLYWIRPLHYMGLDDRNKQLIINLGIFKDDAAFLYNRSGIPTAEEYLHLRNALLDAFEKKVVKYHNFPELSSDAYYVFDKQEKSHPEKSSAMFKGDVKKFLQQCIKSKNILRTGDNQMPTGEFKTVKGKYSELNYITSFGQGRLTFSPWLVFEAYNQKVSRGVYPCLLFDAQSNTNNLEVSYGVSVTENSNTPWNNSYTDGLSHSKIKKFSTSYIYSEYTINSESDINDDILNQIINDLDVVIKNFKDQFGQNEKLFPTGETQKHDRANIPLNQILYGPPGTGKTYNTVVECIHILDRDLYNQYLDSGNKVEFYETKLLPMYNKYRDDGRIEFITFHQSYSYEEFVEGIKPQISEWGLTEGDDVKYIGKDGIFKIICKNARQIRTDKKSNKIDFTKTRIFKMSLGANCDGEDIYNYCLNNNVVALGWGGDEDFSNCNTASDFKKVDNTWGAKAVEIFKNWMRIGDIILISNGTSNIKAIAQITGNYEYHNDTEIKYCQFRNVNWLYSGEDIPVSKFYDKKLSKQAINGFYSATKEGQQDYNSTINTNILNEIITGNINEIEEQPYVLIIDEINRGNISKIFGELITLIEEDKRGKWKTKLPYSQEPFFVPDNLWIIGTMNTADRSIATIDIALRRRFKFIEMMPDSNLVDVTIEKSINLKDLMEELNNRISVLIDRDHQIGHAYFMHIDTLDELKDAWFDKILPLLNEYFYGDWHKLKLVVGEFIDEKEVPSYLKEEYGDEKLYSFKTKEKVDFISAISSLANKEK